MNRQRNRWLLIAFVLLFATPLVSAIVLHAIDWRPAGTRNFGELLSPPVDINGFRVRDENNAVWAWSNPDAAWTLLIQTPVDCTTACWDRLALLTRMREATGRFAPRLRLLLIDRTPTPERRAELKGMHYGIAENSNVDALREPIGDGPKVWLVDPHGFLALRYRAGFEPTELNQDIHRLIK